MIMQAKWPARLTRLGLAAVLGVGALGLAFGPALAQDRKEREEDRPKERPKERPDDRPREPERGRESKDIQEAREAVDRMVERGGHVARFAGNFHWQTRIEDGGHTQTCYKLMARAHDPEANTRRITANWEDAAVGWPGAATFGLNSSYGIYAGVGQSF